MTNNLSKHLVRYADLKDLYTFRIKTRNGYRIMTKVGNSHAIDERTGKDVILALQTKVEPLYPVVCSVIN